MKLRYTPRAAADLERIVSYVAQRSPTGARNVRERVDAALQRLVAHPMSAPATSHPEIRVCFVGRYPYMIFYRVRGDEIHIVHIRHTARRPFARR